MAPIAEKKADVCCPVGKGKLCACLVPDSSCPDDMERSEGVGLYDKHYTYTETKSDLAVLSGSKFMPVPPCPRHAGVPSYYGTQRLGKGCKVFVLCTMHR